MPIFIERDKMILYNLFVEQFLYTLFHNFKGSDANDLDELNIDLWHAYCDVNQTFVQHLIQVKKENDMIWIHNLYLMLCPLYIKRHDINANIGFYLHSPFPSSDIFRTFVYRNEIIKSLLCCDVIGFHIFENARNLIAVCEKLLKLEISIKKGGFIVIEYNGRNILVKINHIGIDQEDMATMLRS